MSSSAKFEAKLREGVEKTIALGYTPTKFVSMLNSRDAVVLAKGLIASGDIQDGMQKVVDLGAPQLTMESIMLEADFAGLFTQGELEAAKWRLERARNHRK